jgi:hypothetical protein
MLLNKFRKEKGRQSRGPSRNRIGVKTMREHFLNLIKGRNSDAAHAAKRNLIQLLLWPTRIN